MQWQGGALILGIILVIVGMFLMWGWPTSIIVIGTIAILSAFGSM